MDALAEVSPTGAPARKPLRCNCTRVMAAGDQVLNVKSRSWDCPSCGHDKRKTIADMCSIAKPERMVTLTYAQPVAVSVAQLRSYRQLDPAARVQPMVVQLHRAALKLGLELAPPPEHQLCDPGTHVYEYVSRRGHKSLRWRTMSTCSHCCRRKSKMMIEWRKRLRRRFGDQVQYLAAVEDQVNGSLHVHLAVVGLPRFSADSDDAAFIRQAWLELGGGSQVDLGHMDDARAGRSMGWYIGKYLAKRHDQKVAHGFRRWTRTAGFAPQLSMGPERRPARFPGVQLVQLGWRPPDPSLPRDAVSSVRWWDPPGAAGAS